LDSGFLHYKRERYKEVFYLMILSPAKMWYSIGGMIMTKENRSDGKVKVHPETGHARTHRWGT
jgi:hypothetical protein